MRGRPRPAERGQRRCRLPHAEPRAEERRSRVAYRDGEQPPVSKGLGHAAAVRPRPPGRIGDVTCSRLPREVREAHEPLVHLARRLHELRVRIAPHDKASFPPLGPEKRVKIGIGHDRLAAGMDVAFEHPDCRDGRGLLARARPHLRPRLAREQERDDARGPEREDTPPEKNLEPGADGQEEHEHERYGVARHRATVEQPQGKKERHEDEREIHGATSPPEGEQDEAHARDRQDGHRATPREKIPHEEGVEKRAHRARRERMRAESRAFRERREKPRRAARLGEEPDAPRRRARQRGQDERPRRVGPARTRHDPNRPDEEEREEAEQEVRPHAAARGRQKAGRKGEEAGPPGGDEVAPARLVRRAALLGIRETGERAEEQGRRRRVGEGAPAVDPDDRKRVREDDARERRPAADDAAPPQIERGHAARGEHRGCGRKRVERRHAERQEGAAHQDPERKAGSLGREVEQVEARDGPGKYGLVYLSRRVCQREET